MSATQFHLHLVYYIISSFDHILFDSAQFLDGSVWKFVSVNGKLIINLEEK
jgi:hypothetical protein